MKTILFSLLATLASLLWSRAALHLEILPLRQQLAMLTARDRKRLRFRHRERLFWVWLYRLWLRCLETLAVFKAPVVLLQVIVEIPIRAMGHVLTKLKGDGTGV